VPPPAAPARRCRPSLRHVRRLCLHSSHVDTHERPDLPC
jgi:hypothetical protein